MSFWDGFGLGFRSFFKAFELVFSSWKMGLFLLVPIFLNVLLFWGGNELLDTIAESTQTWLLNKTGLDTTGESVVSSIISGIIGFLFKVVFFMIFIYTGGYLVLAVMSPVLAYLSEKTEKVLTGKDYPFDGEQWMRDMVRGILIVVRNLLIEVGLIIAVFAIGLIPVLGQIVSLFGVIFLFFVSAYFYGFSFLDYSMERRKMSMGQSIKFIRKNKGLAISTGGIFAVCLLIPMCGPTMGTFFAIFSVVGASASIVEYEKKQNVNQNL